MVLKHTCEIIDCIHLTNVFVAYISSVTIKYYVNVVVRFKQITSYYCLIYFKRELKYGH